MSTDHESIVLGGRPFEVKTPPLGMVKKLVPAFARVGVAFDSSALRTMTQREQLEYLGKAVTDEVMDDMVLIVAAGLGIPQAEAEQIPATMPELQAALPVIAKAAGLEDPAKAAASGKPQGAGAKKKRP